jgi:3-hydroxyisobutyrate dehydrogenase-like beta-hydroxyacid dehydrogenase
MAETLGFIGLGKMGEPIAANLLKAGYGLRVYNRTASKAAELVAQGAEVAGSARETAEAGGIVLSMLADDRAVEEVSAGAGSFVEKLGRGGVHISLSTIAASTAKRLAEHHAKYGVEYVAAPVFGRPAAAAAKLLWVCTSGKAEAKKRARPVLEAIGRGIFDFGEEVGAANVLKLCGNFLIASAIEALAEALTLARKNGLDPAQAAEMLGQTLFACPVYQGYGKQVAGGEFGVAGFGLALGLKDVNLVLQTAAGSAMPMPFASVLRDRLLASVAKGRAEMDWTALTLDVAESAGLQ